jgi:hypothetical protein
VRFYSLTVFLAPKPCHEVMNKARKGKEEEEKKIY